MAESKLDRLPDLAMMMAAGRQSVRNPNSFPDLKKRGTAHRDTAPFAGRRHNPERSRSAKTPE
jgi:hypothetical protein